jgi:hypothetical protein
MVIINTVRGSVLEPKDTNCIAHQCNCLTVKSHGLSAQVARRFKWADDYSIRKSHSTNTASIKSRRKPGTIRIYIHPMLASAQVTRVICMFAQWCPGKCGGWSKFYPKDYVDTRENREEWFQQCLDAMDSDETLNHVAVPHRIGCGLAGGSWEAYRIMLHKATTKFTIYHL